MKLLLCLDHSAASNKAADFVAGVFGGDGTANLGITLFHVAELLPEYLLMCSPVPGMTPRELAETWSEQAKLKGQQLLDEHHRKLVQAGIPAASLQQKLSTASCRPESKKVAAALAIIEEIKSGGYDVVCLGRRGASQLASSFIGGVAEKVVRECHGKTVWLVD